MKVELGLAILWCFWSMRGGWVWVGMLDVVDKACGYFVVVRQWQESGLSVLVASLAGCTFDWSPI